MAMTETGYAHIVLDEHRVPQITDANTKVVEVVTDHVEGGLSPEEIAYQHPHLTLGQIHSALAYYWDHQAELDEDMARRAAYAEEMRRTTPVPPVIERIRARLRIGVPVS